MSSHGREIYQRNSFATASAGEILLALFDGALRFIAQARQGIVDESPKIKGENISRAMNILAELAGTLDDRFAPELCEQLRQLYAYYGRRLRDASAAMDVGPLDEVSKHLQELRDTWKEALRRAANP